MFPRFLMFPRTNVSTDKVVSPLWLRSLSLLEVDRPLHTALRMAKLPISDVGGSMEQPAGFMLHTGLSGLYIACDTSLLSRVTPCVSSFIPVHTVAGSEYVQAVCPVLTPADGVGWSYLFNTEPHVKLTTRALPSGSSARPLHNPHHQWGLTNSMSQQALLQLAQSTS